MSLTLSSERTVTLNGLSDLDACRVAILAKAFGGRYVPALTGYAFKPAEYESMKTLFDAGMTWRWAAGERRYFIAGNRKPTWNRKQALEIARALQ